MRRGRANLLFLFAGLLAALLLVSARPWILDKAAYERTVGDDRLHEALRSPDMASRVPAEIELEAAGGRRLQLDGPAAAVLLLVGLGALYGRDLAERLSKAGRHLLLPSVLVLCFIAMLAVPGGLFLQNLIFPDAKATMSGAGGQLLRDYPAAVMGPVAKSFFLTGLVGASVGGVLASAREFGERKESEE